MSSIFDGRDVGVASFETVMSMSGLEYMKAMIAGECPAPPISKTLNFWLTEAEEGKCVFEGEPTFDSYNPLGIVHGGWPLTLIDSATGCAAHTCLPAGVGYTTVETKANMVRPLSDKTGLVRCTGNVIARGRQIMTAEARLETLAGKLIAHGTSTLITLSPPG